jgi:4-hydroxy-tetrahydrodipicolinate synthase
MPRHKTYLPHGVIPAVLLPFDADLAIDEAGFRKHLRDVAETPGSRPSPSTRIRPRSPPAVEEQRRVLSIAQDESAPPLVNGIWADGVSRPRLARAGDRGWRVGAGVSAGASLGQSPAMARPLQAHCGCHRPAADRFQYPLSTDQGYPKDTFKLCGKCRPSAPSRTGSAAPHHEWHVRTLQSLRGP